MPLTDTTARTAKPTDKAYKLADEKGMFLLVQPNGGKYWRMKFRYAGKENILALGVYPEVSLKEARQKRDEARKLLAEGIDPSQIKKATKAARYSDQANSFEVIAREWFEKFTADQSESHRTRTIRRLERDIFPWLGGLAIDSIEPPTLLASVRRIEERGALETAHRALQNCGQIFRYAVATGRCKRDPSADLKGALPPVRGSHFAAVTEPDQVAQLLRAIDGYEGTLVVRNALRLAALVFVRPGELRTAKWSEIDLEAKEWRYTVTKTKSEHIVPLCLQAVEILEELKPLTGRGEYVFPSARTPTRPMSDNAILSALRRMGIDKDTMSGHGFRAMARTILDEVLQYRVDIIEQQLAHAVKDPNGRAYNRTKHLPERHKMMQAWANYLDGLKAGAVVISLKQA